MEAELQAQRESLAFSKKLSAKKKLVTQHKGVLRQRKQGKALKGKGALPDTKDYVNITAVNNQDSDGIQGDDVDADKYEDPSRYSIPDSYSQPPLDSMTMTASNSLLPHPQADLVSELEPPSPSLQAAVGSIFSQLETDANTDNRSDIPTETKVVTSQAMDKEGSIMRTAVAEAESTTEVMAAELPVELGRGH